MPNYYKSLPYFHCSGLLCFVYYEDAFMFSKKKDQDFFTH